MLTRNTLKAALFFSTFAWVTVNAATVSRIKTWSDNEILYSSDLNSEFNNLISGGINSISDANISDTAAIDPKKIGSSIAGDGLGRNVTTGVLAVNVDGVGIETAGDALQIKNLGVTQGKIALLAVDSAQLANGSVTTAKINDGTVTAVKLASDSVTTAKILNANVTPAKLSALAYAIGSSSGSFTTTSGTFVDAMSATVSGLTVGRGFVMGAQADPDTADTYIACSGAAVSTTGCEFLISDNSGGTNWIYALKKICGTSPCTIQVPASVLNAFKISTATSHVVRIQARVTAGGSTAIINNSRAFGYQL